MQEMCFLWPVEYGALTQLYAGTMPEALNHNGEVRVSSALCSTSDHGVDVVR